MTGLLSSGIVCKLANGASFQSQGRQGLEQRAACLSCAFQRPFRFPLVTVIGGQEIGADEQRHYIGGIQMQIDVTRPVIVRKNLAVLPYLHKLLPLHQSDMSLELASVALSLCAYEQNTSTDPNGFRVSGTVQKVTNLIQYPASGIRESVLHLSVRAASWIARSRLAADRRCERAYRPERTRVRAE